MKREKCDGIENRPKLVIVLDWRELIQEKPRVNNRWQRNKVWISKEQPTLSDRPKIMSIGERGSKRN